MFRSKLAELIPLAVAFFLAVLSNASQVQADTIYQIQATTTNQAQAYSFAANWVDTNHDKLFEIGELTSFSGVALYIGSVMRYGFFGHLETVPNNAYCQYTDGPINASEWVFYSDSDHTYWAEPVSQWQYQVTGVGSTVPLPPTAYLLGSGLLGLACWRKFRKG
jgi:hypothetical protein